MRRTPNEEAKRWLDQARADLRWATHLVEEGGHYLACFYVPTRYPNGLPDGIPARVYNEKAAREAVELAREVVETVGGLIG